MGMSFGCSGKLDFGPKLSSTITSGGISVSVRFTTHSLSYSKSGTGCWSNNRKFM